MSAAGRGQRHIAQFDLEVLCLLRREQHQAAETHIGKHALPVGFSKGKLRLGLHKQDRVIAALGIPRRWTERGELPGVENIFSFFSLYQRSVIWTLISTGFPLSLVVARLNSKGTPGLNFSRTSPGARPSDCAEVTGGQAAIDNRNKIVLNA